MKEEHSHSTPKPLRDLLKDYLHWLGRMRGSKDVKKV